MNPKMMFLVGAVACCAAVILARSRGNDAVEALRDDALAAVKADDPVADKMRRFANQAVIDAWDQRRVVLDWSEDSIQELERGLGDLRAHPNFASFKDKDVWAEALIAGAYVGEVCRRRHGGSWHLSIPEVPDQEWVLTLPNANSIFPVGWAYKRLRAGDEDNVWHKYQLTVLAPPPGKVD